MIDLSEIVIVDNNQILNLRSYNKIVKTTRDIIFVTPNGEKDILKLDIRTANALYNSILSEYIYAKNKNKIVVDVQAIEGTFLQVV